LVFDLGFALCKTYAPAGFAHGQRIPCPSWVLVGA
jgi:hypothetical protein